MIPTDGSNNEVETQRPEVFEDARESSTPNDESLSAGGTWSNESVATADDAEPDAREGRQTECCLGGF